MAFRLLLELIPGRATSLKSALDDLDRLVKQIAHEAITEVLMTLGLPGEVLSLGRDVPGTFPADLATIANPDLRSLLGRVDPTPDTHARAAAPRTGRSWRNGSTSSPICFASTRSARPC